MFLIDVKYSRDIDLEKSSISSTLTQLRHIEPSYVTVNPVTPHLIHLRHTEPCHVTLNPVTPHLLHLRHTEPCHVTSNPATSHWTQLRHVESSYVTLNPASSHWTQLRHTEPSCKSNLGLVWRRTAIMHCKRMVVCTKFILQQCSQTRC